MKVRVTDDHVTYIYLSSDDLKSLVTAKVMGFDNKLIKRPWFKTDTGETLIMGLESEMEDIVK